MNKHKQRKLRQRRVRARIFGTPDKPRLNVFRSLTNIYAQLIDDESGRTLAQASSKEIKSQGSKSQVAAEVGKIIAKKADGLGIKQVVFDRAGYQYHGRVKNLADSAREAGLKF